MKNTPLVAWVIIGVCLIGAVMFAVFASTKIAPRLFWGETSIACVKNNGTEFATRVVATLHVTADGHAEAVPTGIGVAGNCIAEIHSVTGDGTIEILANTPEKTYTLNDLFLVWGRNIDREGYSLMATVNGSSTPSIGGYVIKDKDVITLAYKKQ